MPKRFKLGRSLGAIFKVLQKTIQRGHVEERQVFYVPFNLEIKVAKLSVMTKKKERAIYMKSMMEFLEMLEACD